MRPPRPFSALPPVNLCEASPKAISRRTSYLRVRLEFLRYPQVIPAFFNSDMQLHALFRLAFASAPGLQPLTSLHPVTRRSVLQKVRDHTSIVLSLLVSTGFQVLFHSPPGVLFTFPSRYYALSVTGSYLALEGGPPCFPPDSSCPVVLWYRLADSTFRIRASYPLWKSFPELFS